VKNQRKVNNFSFCRLIFDILFNLGFVEQLSRQNQNRHLSRDDSTLDFLLYIFDSIDLLRTTNI
jgi:hypothetical protein